MDTTPTIAESETGNDLILIHDLLDVDMEMMNASIDGVNIGSFSYDPYNQCYQFSKVIAGPNIKPFFLIQVNSFYVATNGEKYTMLRGYYGYPDHLVVATHGTLHVYCINKKQVREIISKYLEKTLSPM